jgi:hypothetical protein
MATASIALRNTTVTASAPSWTNAAAADIEAIEIQNMYCSCGRFGNKKGESPETGMARGLSQRYGVFNYGLVCPTLKHIMPSNALVVVELLHRLDRYSSIARMITGISSAASLATLLIRRRSAAGGGKWSPFVGKKSPKSLNCWGEINFTRQYVTTTFS